MWRELELIKGYNYFSSSILHSLGFETDIYIGDFIAIKENGLVETIENQYEEFDDYYCRDEENAFNCSQSPKGFNFAAKVYTNTSLKRTFTKDITLKYNYSKCGEYEIKANAQFGLYLSESLNETAKIRVKCDLDRYKIRQNEIKYEMVPVFNCLNTTCSGSGFCRDLYSGFNCICFNGHYGTECEMETSFYNLLKKFATPKTILSISMFSILLIIFYFTLNILVVLKLKID